jgi:hypothetical protein
LQQASRLLEAPHIAGLISGLDRSKIGKTIEDGETISPTTDAAWIAGCVSLLVSGITGAFASRLQMAKLHAELRTEFMVEAALHKLLKHQKHSQRSFDKIRHHIPCFEDNELRRYLVRAGAVAFKHPTTGDEMWGLPERNQEVFQ